MVISFDDLILSYAGYTDIKGKVRREVASGKLIQLKKGLYEDNPSTPGHYLSAFIYGPSYLSFDYALYKYALIPEAVYNTYTSATFNKNRKKMYTNHFGTYLYQDIPEAAYPYSVLSVVENGYTYHIATPEKALCDKLYSLSPVKSIRALKDLLFDDLRIDEGEFRNLKSDIILQLCPKYHSTNLNLLSKIVEGTI